MSRSPLEKAEHASCQQTLGALRIIQARLELVTDYLAGFFRKDYPNDGYDLEDEFPYMRDMLEDAENSFQVWQKLNNQICRERDAANESALTTPDTPELHGAEGGAS